MATRSRSLDARPVAILKAGRYTLSAGARIELASALEESGNATECQSEISIAQQPTRWFKTRVGLRRIRSRSAHDGGDLP